MVAVVFVFVDLAPLEALPPLSLMMLKGEYQSEGRAKKHQ
jgi:hypothetical protein